MAGLVLRAIFSLQQSGMGHGGSSCGFLGGVKKPPQSVLSLTFYYMSKTSIHLCGSASASLVRGCSGAHMAQAEVMAGCLLFKCCGIHQVCCLKRACK